MMDYILKKGGLFMKKKQNFIGSFSQIKNNKNKENLDTAIKEIVDFFYLNNGKFIDLK